VLYFVSDELVLERWSGTAWDLIGISTAPAENAVGALLRAGSEQAITTSAWNELTNWTDVWDSDAMGGATDIVIPSGGPWVWRVSFEGNWTAHATGIRIGRINASSSGTIAYWRNAGGHGTGFGVPQMSMSVEMPLVATETISCSVYQSSGGNLNFPESPSNTYSRFSVVRVGLA